MKARRLEAPPARPPGPARGTTPLEDFVTCAAALWVTLGLFVDGYAHQNILDTATEDFFTPYHLGFYTGFAALAGWIAILSLRNRPAPTVWAMVPTAYRVAVAGLAVFAVGGISDGTWHQVIGVESGLDALLSPSHLLLMVGLVLMMSAPVHAAHLRDPDRRSGWASVGPAMIGAALALAIIAFFNFHSWGLAKDHVPQHRYVGRTDEGEGHVAAFAGALLATTAMLFMAASLLRRWVRVPVGGFLLLFVVPNLLLVLAFQESPRTVATGASAGIVLELARFRSASPIRGAVAAALAGAVMWSGFFVGAWASGPVRWPASIWTGLIVLGALAAGVVTLLAPGPILAIDRDDEQRGDDVAPTTAAAAVH